MNEGMSKGTFQRTLNDKERCWKYKFGTQSKEKGFKNLFLRDERKLKRVIAKEVISH